ncbi:GNAT family N-acetyltransferase [Actinoplanes sp. NPDC051470]|uniref:GNAT family N-acetyltransferase n=1 Tax=Actinoplanes sp. NPDC051470 TaxID=3157224 RepID=UPI00342CE6E9
MAEVRGRAGRYQPDVAPWHGLADSRDPVAWADLAALIGPGAEITLAGVSEAEHPGWERGLAFEGVQLVDVALRTEPDPEALLLGPADVPEMLDLVRRTEPGPFLPRTIEMGTYLGLRHGGRLVAMAGERLHPPGWTEISAVCTDPAFRGRGYATRLVRAVADGIHARGETPFLHASARNLSAIRLYESIGFALRRRVTFTAYRTT